MTVEVKSEETLMTGVSIVEPIKAFEKTDDVDVAVVSVENSEERKEEKPKTEEAEEKKRSEAEAVDASPSPVVEKSSSFKEENNFGSDLKDYEKKALNDLKLKIEEAILANKIFEEKEKEKLLKEEEKEKEEQTKEGGEETEKSSPEVEEKEKPNEEIDEKSGKIIDTDISLWGVPLLPSKGKQGIDVILLKFLRAREFKVNEAFEMLVNTLRWRKEFKIDSILDEDLGSELSSVAYMDGVDCEGHPICYNIYGVFENEELYQKTFGTEEKRQQFLRWRFQLMEKGIQKIDFKPGCVSSLLQINDLKNSPGPSKKELRIATKQAVALLQDNYPELVARNIFINVPFWYYAFSALLSPFLTQRTKSKFVFARPSKVTETLLKYIPVHVIPIRYGGLKRENDFEFSVEECCASELFVKAGLTETVEIPAPEVGTTLLWDLTVLGWEVNYKEEFVPSDEGSYTIIVQKGKKIGWNEEPIRNSFTNKEPGKVVLTIVNGSFKKKRVLYRYKTKKSSS